MGAVTYLGRSGFHLWGLSANQNCRQHVCPVRYETESVERCATSGLANDSIQQNVTLTRTHCQTARTVHLFDEYPTTLATDRSSGSGFDCARQASTQAMSWNIEEEENL